MKTEIKTEVKKVISLRFILNILFSLISFFYVVFLPYGYEDLYLEKERDFDAGVVFLLFGYVCMWGFLILSLINSLLVVKKGLPKVNYASGMIALYSCVALIIMLFIPYLGIAFWHTIILACVSLIVFLLSDIYAVR